MSSHISSQNAPFSPTEIQEVLRRIEERNICLKEAGFDFRAAIEAILRVALPLPQPILEIATGKGRFLAELARHVHDVVTVDCDAREQRIARILTYARGVAARIKFLQADAAKLPFPDHAFSTILSMNTFHHLQSPQAVLLEMARLVKPHGKVVISDFNDDGYAAMERLHAKDGMAHPRAVLDMEEIATFWRSLGWRVRCASAPCQQLVIAEAQGV
ncbi:MAG: class I SAM-dependent methyltransferase [Candidatus Sumerlaeaceae bacterium]|nr:class I SAM-dependent methyltransferase [Candidatus Sumerlaeaceae bacterium]